MQDWREKAGLREKVLRALKEQPTFDDFKRAVERETDYVFDLRGANPTLDGDLLDQRDVRLSRLGLRRQFWLRLVTGWTTDYGALADEQGADAVPHLWRGLMGARLAPDQRPGVREFVKQAGVVETAQALCQVVNGNPENTPADDVFQRFGERCRKAIEERMKKGLPMPLVKRPQRRPGIDLSRLDRLPKALGIDGDQCPRAQVEAERGPRDQVMPRRRRPTTTKPQPIVADVAAGRVRLTEGGFIDID